MKILVVIGTRPEAIKLAPVVWELRRRQAAGGQFEVRVCVTAQQRDLLDPMLRDLDLRPDHDLDLMRDGQSPAEVAAAVLRRLPRVLGEERPDWLVVQGDTTSAAAAAQAGLFAGVRIAHVEAGLRSGVLHDPFPEEANRRWITAVADLHCAPSPHAARVLRHEGVPAGSVIVTGNPVIDVLRWALARPEDERGGPEAENHGCRQVLLTAHRRESFGAPLEGIAAAVRTLAARHRDDLRIVCPVHPNPNVSGLLRRRLGGLPNVVLVPPLPYVTLVHFVRRCHFVLTDSGGLQEEAPFLGRPVLVMRRVTERPEIIEAGAARLVGTEPDRILAAAESLLDDEVYRRMARPVAPYGTGDAAPRIAEALLLRAGVTARRFA